jgi:acetylornithine deacetylase/succinyl-diaminopimelate desuccinylase-like protein
MDSGLARLPLDIDHGCNKARSGICSYFGRSGSVELIYQRPEQLLQNLIRFDTTNPPGNEAACAGYVRSLLDEAGIPSQIISWTDTRPNLIARLTGEGYAPPLLLYGHLDVVTTEGQMWAHPPFGGEIHEGYVWGRGALDMKGPDAMLISAFLRAHVESAELPGDVILCLVSDEEGGGDDGALFLMEQHADLFDGVRYALGEFGGFTFSISGKRFYPIMVAEKQVCWLKATLHGPAGHGSLVHHDTAAAKLGAMLSTLDRRRLPVHITPAARAMFEGIAGALPFPTGTLLRQLLNPALTDRVLNVLGEQARTFDPLLHNTVNATIIRGGDKINVIPAEVIVELDGRLLPGFAPDDMLRELQALLGDDIEFELIRYDPGPTEPDMGLFPILADILKEWHADSTAAVGSDGCTLFLAPRHSDLRLHADAASAGFQLRGNYPRC